MSEWNHEYIGENGEKHLRETMYPSRAWALSSADHHLIGLQCAYDKGMGRECEVPFRPKKVRVVRVSDGWCYAESNGDIFKMNPDGKEPSLP